MLNFKKISRDTLITLLKAETSYKVSRFHKPATAEGMYEVLTGGVSLGLETVLVSDGQANFTPLDTNGFVRVVDYTLELFLATNNIRGSQLEDVDRPSDVMFSNIETALHDFTFAMGGNQYNFQVDSLSPLFFEQNIEVQQMNLVIDNITYTG